MVVQEHWCISKRPANSAQLSPNSSIVILTISPNIFIPLFNTLLIARFSFSGHIEVVFFAVWCCTTFRPNDCHGNKLFPLSWTQHFCKNVKKRKKWLGACCYCLYIHFLWFWKRPLVLCDQRTLLWRFSGTSPNTRTPSMCRLHQILNWNPPEPFTAQSSTGRATIDPTPITAGSPQHPFKQVKQQAFFPPLFVAPWILSMAWIPIRLLDPTLSPAASVSPYTALNPPPPHPPHSLQRLKSVATPVMENCLSGHGRSSRLIESIVTSWDFCFGISNQAAQNGQWIAGSVQKGVQWDQIVVRRSDLCFRAAAGFKNVFIHVPWIPSLGIMPAKLWDDRSYLSSKKTGKLT